MKGVKHDQQKLRWELLPLNVIEEIVRVMTFGAVKYEEDGWKTVPNGKQRYYAAMMRHIAAFKSGQTYDEESGLHHLSHALCCIVFWLWLELDRGEMPPQKTTPHKRKPPTLPPIRS